MIDPSPAATFNAMASIRSLRTPTLCALLSALTFGCEGAKPSDPAGESAGSGTQTPGGTGAKDTGTTGGDGQGTDGTGTSTVQPDPAVPDPEIPGLEQRKSKLTRVTPQVSEADKVTLRDGNRDLSFDLLRNSDKGANENVAVSAVSVRSAFGMVHAMAKGETQSQIASELKLLADPAKAQAGINDIDQTLLSRNLEKTSDLDPVIMTTGNRMFVKKGMVPGTEFLDTLAKNYGAGIYETDFAGDAEGSRKAINSWVSKKTFEKIPDLLPKGAIKPNTAWVLTNAMYFRAPWATPLEKRGAFDFTRTDNSVVSAEGIYGSEISTHYGQQPDFEWAQIPLRGGNLSAMVILPNAGKYAQVETTMSASVINKMIAEQKRGNIEITLPKFKIKTGSMNYTNYLKQKLPLAFETADFSGFGGSEMPIPITFVFHSVFLAADEKGVEAAAATAVGGDESAPEHDFTMTVDRPFLFLVYDQPSGLILFTGRVMDPTA